MAKIDGKYKQIRIENLQSQIDQTDSITKRHHLLAKYLDQRCSQIEKILANIEDDDIDTTLVNDKIESIQGINVLDNVVEYDCCLSSGIEEVKPYLFPMSCMTEEQKREYIELLLIGPSVGIDWLNKNHFDYRGLIEKGLAINATNLNIY